MKNISATVAESFLQSEAIFIDVRPPREFEKGCVPGAINVPIRLIHRDGELLRNLRFLDVMQAGFEKDQLLILVCNRGFCSNKAGSMLERAGFNRLFGMRYGFKAGSVNNKETLPGWLTQGREMENWDDIEEDRTYVGLVNLLNRWGGSFNPTTSQPSLVP